MRKRNLLILLLLLLGVSANAQHDSLSFADDVRRVSFIRESIDNKISEYGVDVSGLLNEMLSIYQKHYTAESPQYADCLMWCAMICSRVGDDRQANALLKQSCKLFKQCGSGGFAGRDTIHEILRLDIQSAMESHYGRELYAVSYAEKSCKLKAQYFGEEKPAYLQSVLDLSQLYAERLSKRKSRLYHNIGYRSYVELVKREFCEKSESERTMYWNTAVKYINKTLDVAYKTKSRAGGENSMPVAAYDALLLSKGLLLNTTLGFENYIIESGNEEAVRALQQKKQLASQNASQKVLDSLDYVILDALKDAGLTYNIPHLSVNWKQVQAQLGDDDVAVEFFKNTDDEYAAVLVRKEMKTPRIVTLGKYVKQGKKLVPLHKLLKTNPIEYCTSDDADNLWRLSKAVWTDELLKYFPVTDTGKVFFAADGELLVTGIEYLPVLSPKKRKGPLAPYDCISDIYQIYRLSSTRELVMRDPEWANAEAVIYGGLDYGMPSEDMLADARRYASMGTEQLAFRQRGEDPAARGSIDSIKFLPGTKVEADSIVSTIRQSRQMSLDPTLYVGQNGTEASFKALSGMRKKVLHVATHGYFYNLSDSTFNRFGLGDNPLVRSGLYFAGANNKWFGEPIPAGVDDGFLTSLEIANLDFRGVDMVAMSACETGKGNISGDGVFGLQRGFKMAGANSILMSLWKVDDDATCLLMTEFYKNWMNGMGKNEALNAAKNAVRSHTEKGWDNPKYWAAFILLDGLD